MDTTSTYAFTVEVAKLSGWFALGGAFVGAFIGALAAYLTTRMQLESTRNIDIDRRLFDARRDAYEKAVAIFTFAQDERIQKKPYPATEEDRVKIHEVLGPMNLWSSTELIEETRSFFHYLATPIPVDLAAFASQQKEGIIAFQRIIIQMRKEIGTGNFFKDQSQYSEKSLKPKK